MTGQAREEEEEEAAASISLTKTCYRQSISIYFLNLFNLAKPLDVLICVINIYILNHYT